MKFRTLAISIFLVLFTLINSGDLIAKPTSDLALVPPSLESGILTNALSDPKNNLSMLSGQLDPKYGIRADIVKSIEADIPRENAAARKSAIALIALQQKIYYQATQAQALKLLEKEFICIHCLYRALPSRQDRVVFKKIMGLMVNTPERYEHVRDIDEKYFGWHVLGTGKLTMNELDKICDEGAY